jgi:hypothetical protein
MRVEGVRGVAKSAGVEKSRKAGIEWALRVRILAVDLPGRIGSTQRVDLRGLGRRITGM